MVLKFGIHLLVRAPEKAMGSKKTNAVDSREPTVIGPVPYCRIENFLSPSQLKWLIADVLAREAQFRPGDTATHAEDYREALVLHATEEVFPEFAELLATCVPLLRTTFPLGTVESFDVERQITAHNDGGYYRPHNDGSLESNGRLLTYVYYFHREPKAFEGGELLLFDQLVRDNRLERASSFHVIPPDQNSIVFFRSADWHEVSQVRCPSRSFADSRFTINGWIHAAAATPAPPPRSPKRSGKR
jgi:Rps23 Pro-64 3,4-dihydroxylase Tpa1-like proline 4-hydroxylase